MILQQDSEHPIDLSSFFFIGPNHVPSFGVCTEIIMPWNSAGQKTLTLSFRLAEQAHVHGISTTNPYFQGPMFSHPHHITSSPYALHEAFAYATLSVVGYIL